MEIAPLDVPDIIRAIAYGVAALCVPVCSVYLMITASKVRAKTDATATAVTVVKEDLSKVKDTIELVERNTNSLTTQLKASAHKNGLVEGVMVGEKRGEELAEQLAQGQREGREIERASVVAQTTSISSPAAVLAGHPAQDEVPVKDNRVASAVAEVAGAIKENAAAMDKGAEATKEATKEAAKKKK